MLGVPTMNLQRSFCLVLTTTLLACGSDDGDDGAATTSGTTAVGSTGPGSTGVQGESTGSPGTTTAPAESTGDAPTTGDATGSTGVDGSGSGADTGSSTGAVEPSPECAQYCTEFLAHCQEIPDIEAYDDEADCLATCAGFPHGEPGTFQGDSVECRVDHLTFDPNPSPGYYEMHCFHAQEHPTSQCV